MESKVLGRSLVVEARFADKVRAILEVFLNVGCATLKDESYYGKYAEFVIGCCNEGVFLGIISDIMAEGIELF